MFNTISMLAMQVYGRVGVDHYGFAGIGGLFGLLIGVIVMVVIVAILFKIVKLLLPALGVGEPWGDNHLLAYGALRLSRVLALLWAVLRRNP